VTREGKHQPCKQKESYPKSLVLRGIKLLQALEMKGTPTTELPQEKKTLFSRVHWGERKRQSKKNEVKYRVGRDGYIFNPKPTWDKLNEK